MVERFIATDRGFAGARREGRPSRQSAATNGTPREWNFVDWSEAVIARFDMFSPDLAVDDQIAQSGRISADIGR
jgi:hypothetical protein